MGKIFYRLSNAVIDFFALPYVKPNINYYAGISAMSAMAYELSGDEKYRLVANKYEDICYKLFDRDGLLAGEGSHIDRVTEKGCRPIDMGYNLEESLPLLVTYAVRIKDKNKLEFYKDKVIKTLDFLLPDGAIDNSFGTRQNKWTYFGSRTSDGMQEGLIYISDEPIIAKAVYKNFDLMERCTVEGYFYPGLMCYEANQPPCIHHAFAHGKSLALMYLKMKEKNFENIDSVELPREAAFKLSEFQNGNLAVVSVGDFTATVNASDFIVYPGAENSGGNLTMLWHKKYGAICSATMNVYTISEPFNMQHQRLLPPGYESMTPRVVLEDYQGDKDMNARLETKLCGNKATIKALSRVNITYEFSKDFLKISVTADSEGYYSLPIVCSGRDKIIKSDNSFVFKELLTVSANKEIHSNLPLSERIYNPVGGFLYAPLRIELQPNITTEITLKIK